PAPAAAVVTADVEAEVEGGVEFSSLLGHDRPPCGQRPRCAVVPFVSFVPFPGRVRGLTHTGAVHYPPRPSLQTAQTKQTAQRHSQKGTSSSPSSGTSTQ